VSVAARYSKNNFSISSDKYNCYNTNNNDDNIDFLP
jgi:hypothetical protein